ncbi:hypothetical protein C8F04DRAFT_1241770 [Mycena alexandri]|uniref:Uncharacterized protein n=1 Tax=Mycena alexandri TaxID=1745969 RepID=A0AAD6S6I1_9AGAR|nr:hypothetical protein C8F04DRAFT_1241770 [Mycena alexandri]
MARTNDGASLVSGIQDISAFLPIIGTDQCERHVGEALDGGYLYAAATPLSMFGSLGIVKASTAILVASLSPGSAQMLVNAGFKLEGSVAAMLGTAPSKRNTSNSTDNDSEVPYGGYIGQMLVNAGFELANTGFKLKGSVGAMPATAPSKRDTSKNTDNDSEAFKTEYIAAQKLRALLAEQHIDLEKSKVNLAFNYASWNWGLCISTSLLACLSILPYIGLIRDSDPPPRSFPAWAPPILRIAGSAISVIVAQMIIQGKIQQALQSMLDGTEPSAQAPSSDLEKGDSGALGPPPNAADGDKIKRAALLGPPPHNITSRIRFAVLQLLLFIGIGATAVGYLGCFTVVQNAPASSTYMWLGIEIALALLRIYIWGLNPSWDEATGLTLEIQLPNDFAQAPKITTPQDLQKKILGLDKIPQWRRASFVILTDSEFLEYISHYTGPVERFSDPDNHVAIYYTLAGCGKDGESEEAKALLTTILDLESRTTFLLVNYCSVIDSGRGSDNPIIYSAASELLEDIGIMTAKCGIQLHPEHKFRNTERFVAIAQHSQTIASRIGGMGRVTRLHVSWGLELSASEFEKRKQMATSPLTQFEKAYLEVQRLAYPWRHRFDKELDLRVVECMATVLELEPPASKYVLTDIAVALEKLVNYESAFFEKHLAARYPSSHIFHQWAQRLEVRQAGKARSEALTTRIAKYQELEGTAENSFSDLHKHVMVVTDIDDNSLKQLPRLKPKRRWPDSVIALLKPQQAQVDHRLALWKDSTSSSPYLAEATFAAYPSTTCANDPELFEIMAERGCLVFDFEDEDTETEDDEDNSIPVPAFDKLPNEHGLSLLRCPEQWVPQLTDLIHSNPRILALQIFDGVGDELQGAVERNRHSWGANTSNLSDGISRFCFADGFKAWSDSMLVPSREAAGFLWIKTDRAGTWRVNFWHHQPIMNAGDVSVSLTLRTQVAADSTLLGTMEISHTEEFKRDSLTVELPAGVHQIDLRFFQKEGYWFAYHLRKVSVTRIRPEGETDTTDDEEDEEDEENPDDQEE